MKPMYWMMYLLGAIFTLSSCVKHDGIFQPKEGTADLVVPEEFDWSSSRAVALTINSPAATEASFFLDESCSSESQIATLAIPEGSTTFNFDIPNANKVIYIQYPSKNESIETLKASIVDTKAKAVAGSVIFTEPEYRGVMNQHIYLPSRDGWGTLMFEDTWPETGDYDFNDVVMNYKLDASYKPTEENMGSVYITVDVSFKIRALGGDLPYDFAMIIGQTKSHEGPFFVETDLLDVFDIKSDSKDITIERLNGTGFPAVIIKGLDALRIPNTYYNTFEKKDEGVSVNFKMKLKSSDLKKFNYGIPDPMAFDYFLINQSTHKEIHFLGYSPTSLYTTYDEDNTGGGQYYYQNEKRLVWALKVPKKIGWAAEKQDIKNVYTEFGQWVENDGTNSYLIWYDEENHTTNNYIKP